MAAMGRQHRHAYSGGDLEIRLLTDSSASPGLKVPGRLMGINLATGLPIKAARGFDSPVQRGSMHVPLVPCRDCLVCLQSSMI